MESKLDFLKNMAGSFIILRDLFVVKAACDQELKHDIKCRKIK